jgi:hypothetical protein
MTDNSYKTATTRKSLSAPMKRLVADKRLRGLLLDYGAGRGSDALEVGMASYDPYFQPVMPTGLFTTITCSYVLNVIESPEERLAILTDIRSRLLPGGKAYITVRNDRKALIGTTSTGSWQGLIGTFLPVVYKTSGFITYLLEAGSPVCLQTVATTFPKPSALCNDNAESWM